MRGLRTPPLAGGLVLIGPLLLTVQGAAGEPLAFAIEDIAQCLPAARSAVAGRVARRVRGGVVTAGAVTEGAEKTGQPRDHARVGAWAAERLEARSWRVAGVRIRPGRAEPALRDRGAAWPGAGPPASGGPRGGTPGPGNSAGSRRAAGTFVHTLCAGRSADAGGALWRVVGGLAYPDRCPREARLPRESPGRMCQHPPRAYQDASLAAALQSKAATRTETETETALTLRAERRRGWRYVRRRWLSPNARNWL